MIKTFNDGEYLTAYRLLWCKLTPPERDCLIKILNEVNEIDVKEIIESDQLVKQYEEDMYGRELSDKNI